ncbi:hypothetical protein MRX96_026610 [Rhipicephalus microplus]
MPTCAELAKRLEKVEALSESKLDELFKAFEGSDRLAHAWWSDVSPRVAAIVEAALVSSGAGPWGRPPVCPVVAVRDNSWLILGQPACQGTSASCFPLNEAAARATWRRLPRYIISYETGDRKRTEMAYTRTSPELAAAILHRERYELTLISVPYAWNGVQLRALPNTSSPGRWRLHSIETEMNLPASL